MKISKLVDILELAKKKVGDRDVYMIIGFTPTKIEHVFLIEETERVAISARDIRIACKEMHSV